MNGPFGALPPSPFQERMRAIGHRLGADYWGRRAASLLLGPAGGRDKRAYDVAVFGSQKARLHPYDNICEKRVYLTPQLWDGEERARLGDFIAAREGGDFIFVDVGANAGLYTLFARAEAMRSGLRFRGLCVEADPDMAARLEFNLSASGALKDVALFNCAASSAEGTLRFTVEKKSRGLSRVDPQGAAAVRARTLHSMAAAAGFDRFDAMKIDIEGHELPALSAFFASAPAALYPRLLMLEISHEAENASALKLAIEIGYQAMLRTKRNAVLVRAS